MTKFPYIHARYDVAGMAYIRFAPPFWPSPTPVTRLLQYNLDHHFLNFPLKRDTPRTSPFSCHQRVAFLQNFSKILIAELLLSRRGRGDCPRAEGGEEESRLVHVKAPGTSQHAAGRRGTVRDGKDVYTLPALTLRRAATVMSYRTSLNAKRKAAVKTLWLTLGPIPRI